MNRRQTPLVPLVLLLPIVACSKGSDSALAPRPQPAKPTATAATPSRNDDSPALASLLPRVDQGAAPANPTPDAAAKPPAERGTALGWIPRDAIFAARAPDLNGHPDAWRNLSVFKALGSVDTGVYRARLDELMQSLRTGLNENCPGGEAVLDIWGELRGEGAFGLFDVQWTARGEMPCAFVLHLSLGDASGRASELLQTIAADSRASKALAEIEPGRWRIDAGDARIDALLHDDWLSVLVAPPDAAPDRLKQLLEQRPEDSFLATDVVREAPHAGTDESAWFEGFVNLTPVWPMLEQMQPDAAPVVEATHLDHVHGLSFVSALAGDSFHDRLSLHSDGQDALTRLMGAAKLDGAWSRYVPSDSANGGLVAFDLDQAFKTILDCLPQDAQSMARMQLDGMQRETGFDLRKDVLRNFGPHFAIAFHGNLMAALSGQDLGEDGLKASLAVQLRDVNGARSLLDKGLEDMPFGRVPHRVDTVRYHSVSLPFPDVPAWLQPSFGFTKDAFVLATSPAAFDAVITASTPGSRNNALDAAIQAHPGAISVMAQSTEMQVLGAWEILQESVFSQLGTDVPLPTAQEVATFAAALPPSLDVWSAGPSGLAYDSVSPIGSSWLAAAPIAIVASIAIPNLLSARITANERAAIASLRALASAQAVCANQAMIDRDHDGTGEYASLAELAGGVPLPGAAPLDPPLFSASFAKVEQGCVERSGYLYRIFLPGRGARMLGERDRGGSADGIDADRAELGFICYAWPVELRSTGNRVFVVNQDGDLLFSDNGYPNQFYSGPDRAPLPDAACAEPATLLEVDAENPWREGQDGGFWMPVR